VPELPGPPESLEAPASEPAAAQSAREAPARRGWRCPRCPRAAIPARAAAGASLCLAVSFTALLVWGAATPCMSLRMDMPLLLQKHPQVEIFAPFLSDLSALLHAEASIFACITGLWRWAAEGDANSALALVMYGGFALLLTWLHMAALVAAAVQLWRGAHNAKAFLAASRVLKKLSMLEVSIMGSVVVTMALRELREHGVVVSLCSGTPILLGAELCRYAADSVVRSAFDSSVVASTGPGREAQEVDVEGAWPWKGSRCEASLGAAEAATVKDQSSLPRDVVRGGLVVGSEDETLSPRSGVESLSSTGSTST